MIFKRMSLLSDEETEVWPVLIRSKNASSVDNVTRLNKYCFTS